jgi:DNA-binding transcriptional LysR family regulator
MDSRRLEAFVAVAEERSFTRAGERLHIVQSGVSASVRALERELGAPLFDRSTQRVELTAAGRALLPEALQILDAIRGAQQAVDEVGAGLRGSLDIGVVHGLTTPEVLDSLSRFRRQHPGVDIRLHGPGPRGSASHIEAVRKGDLDLAVVMKVDEATGVRLLPLATEAVVLACPPHHPLAAAGTVDIADMAGADLLDFPEGWSVRTAVDRAFDAAGIPARSAHFELSDFATVLDLVRHGFGVTFVPESVGRNAPDVVLVPVRDHPPTYELALASPLGRAPSPAATALAALLERTAT